MKRGGCGLNGWEAIRRINESAWSAPVKNLMRTLLQWRDGRTGEAWPSVASIARALGVAESTTRRHLRQAEACGALVPIGNQSGGWRPTRYRMVLPERSENPPESGGFTPPESGPLPTEPRRQTRRNPSPNPPDSGPDPSMIPPSIQPPQPEAVVDLFARLKIEHLSGHANATADRMAWIARAAPEKNIPGAWAASCIREGWEVPPPTPEDEQAAKRADRDAAFEHFLSLSESEQEEVLDEVVSMFPNLSADLGRYRDGRMRLEEVTGVKGAIARVLGNPAECNGHHA